MMTLEELQSSRINASVAREAYEHAAARLADVLATKASHDQKAFALLAAYAAVTLAMYTAYGVLITTSGTFKSLAAPLVFVGTLYALGALVAMLALLDQKYGALGSAPEMWLTPGVIDGGDDALATMLAYVTFYHQDRIDTSLESNKHKALLIRIAIAIGVAAPVVLGSWIWLAL